jgi:drug/metabolite transporter (DMT)-like permease
VSARSPSLPVDLPAGAPAVTRPKGHPGPWATTTVGRSRAGRRPTFGRRRGPASRSRQGVRVAAALAVVYLVWGSTYLAMSVVVTTVPPLLAMAVRFAVAGLLLLLLARLRRPRAAWRLRPGALGQAVVTGVLLLVGGTGLIAVAQTRISSGLAALLASTVPLFLALFARFALGEHLSVRAGAGLLVGLAGIAVLVDPGGGQLLAILLALLGSALWAAGSIRSRRRRGPDDAVVGAGIEMLGAALVFALLALLRGETTGLDVAAIATSTWVALGYLTVAGSVVGYTAYSWLLRHARTTVVGTYAYVNPVVAVALGWFVLGEAVTPRTILAGLLVLSSVALLVTGRPGVPVPAQVTSGADVFAGPRRGRLRRAVQHRVAVSRQAQGHPIQPDAARPAARVPRAARWHGAPRRGSAGRWTAEPDRPPGR